MKLYVPHNCNERLISLGRLMVASLFLLVLLSGTLNVVSAQTATTALFGYFAYALVLVILAWQRPAPSEQYRQLDKMVHWPRTTPADITTLLKETLAHAADILCAQRVVLVWEDNDEPWLYLAEWNRGEFRYTRENPGEFGTVVDDRLASTGFFSPDLRPAHPLVMVESGGTIRRWAGTPLNHRFRDRFAIFSILCVPVASKQFNGYFMALDLANATFDDLVLGGVVAHEVGTRLEHHFLLRRLQNAATLEERVRIARNLHDGLLQTLTGVALHLETAQLLITEDPEVAQQQIATSREVITMEQRELRFHIQRLAPASSGRQDMIAPLSHRLDSLVDRIRRIWGIEALLNVEELGDAVPEGLAQDICFIVNESLINAARHAKASNVKVEISCPGEELRILVSDNGQGFPFHGRYDHESLISMKIGPVTLKERIASCGGSLTVDSRETGARLEISLPLGQMGV